MKAFDYLRSQSLTETIQWLGESQDSEVKALAGGTDLLTLMKAGVATPIRLIDIAQSGLIPKGITANATGVTLGAMTTLTELETSPLLAERYPLLSQAAGLAATPQLRNMATIGGNLLQRPRCWYFRNPHVDCWLKGGDPCPAYDGQNQLHALFGDGPCYAVHPSDLAATLLALEAEVQLRGSTGERTLPLAHFFALPTADRRRETVLANDELLLAVHIPALPADTHSLYLKAMDRKVWAFALVGVAAMLRLAGETIADARLVLSGVAPIPWRLQDVEAQLIGARAEPATFARATQAALAAAQPLAHNGYKVVLAQRLIEQAFTMLGQFKK